VTEQAHTLAPGTQLDNYQIQQVLGVGGFGITYKAIDLNLDCLVAIKEYFPTHLAVRAPNTRQIQPRSRAETTMYEFGLQRFMDEARLLARFTDPNIVRVRRYLEANASAYIIMDYEEGFPLSRYLMRCSTLNETELKLVFQPVLKGLRTVHARDVLHRDIKPPNIYLRTVGSPVLLDFGAARQAVTTLGHDITNLGTHYYAPYEQFTCNEAQGPWTDIYSVGATLYHCLAGQPPTPAIERISAAHANRRDPLLPAVLAGKDRYSLDLLACVDWMLHLDPSDRPQTIDELIPLFDPTGDLAPTETILSRNDMDWNAELIRRAEAHLVTPGTQANSTLAQGPIDEALTEKLIRHLAYHIGPISRLLVRQAVEANYDLEQIIDILARELPDEADRKRFRKQFAIS